MTNDKTPNDDKGAGRRSGDRRKSQQPYDGPDRRKSDRRSETDRRVQERRSGREIPED